MSNSVEVVSTGHVLVDEVAARILELETAAPLIVLDDGDAVMEVETTHHVVVNEIEEHLLELIAPADPLTVEVITEGPQGPAGTGAGVANTVPRSITIVDPQIDDAFTIFRTDQRMTLRSVMGLVQGSNNPSVTYELRYGDNRSTAGTPATGTEVVTSTDSGNLATLVNQPISADSYVWVQVLSVSGDVRELNVSVAL